MAARPFPNRGPITFAIMLATLMNTLDSTIANVALPHIQGSLSAAPDQITWVLTSYIVAAAVMTPMAGWLAGRFGMKRTFIVVITGFTVASMLCGAATSLPQIVLFRALQGMFGAAMIPLSQAVLLNINPPERHPQAMSMWAMGTILGPIFGPVLGGYLTDTLSWRWCFYINLPVGIVATLGVWIFMARRDETRRRAFDFLSFGTLAVALGAFQMMMDRGPSQDWFGSAEIWAYAILAISGLWVFVVHSLTSAHPFFDVALIRDRNLVTATSFGFLTGILIFGSLAILPLLMQSLMGYPALTAGLVSMPRGVGMLLSILLAGRIIRHVDQRLLLFSGLVFSAGAMWQMAHFDLSMDSWPLVSSGFLQGFATGLFFVPLTTLAFATISPALRAEASSVYNLVRNIGASAGISVMQALATANTQVTHEQMAGRVVPGDPVLRATLPAMFEPSTLAGALALDAEINRQAMMTAYVNDFRLMLLLIFVCAPLVLLLRPLRVGAHADPAHALVE
jgi:DHA2 family multidrug resistance protein